MSTAWAFSTRGVEASTEPLRAGPRRILILSTSSTLATALLASLGSLRLSSILRTIFSPLIPPWALTSSTTSWIPWVMASPIKAMVPVMGRTQPTWMSAWAAPASPRQSMRAIANVNNLFNSSSSFDV